MTIATTTTTAQDLTPDPEYGDFLAALREQFARQIGDGANVPLFTTDAADLFAAFLAHIPEAVRQTYVCNACLRFVERFGGLVTVDTSGVQRSLFWEPKAVPPFFRPAVEAMSKALGKAKINGVFLSEEKIWGLPQNKSDKPPYLWKHMAVTPPSVLLAKRTPLLSVSQIAAEKTHDFGVLARGLAEFPVDLVRQAHTLLTTGKLDRSEKCIGIAKWLLELHESRNATKNTRRKRNLVWRAVALAPPGFAHVRSSMIGTLLEDLAAGLDFASIKRKFDEKMHPLQYQRPQALPTRGNLAEAEKVVEKLGIAASLRRRFATLDDLQALWTPRTPEPRTNGESGGVFGHLQAKGEAPKGRAPEAPAVTMTWEKFARTVLPEAERIELLVPGGWGGHPFSAFVTAVDPEAPNILQWDNPVSWYLYVGGSTADRWNLRAGSWVDVQAVVLQPSMWTDPNGYPHQGRSFFFVLDGCRDIHRQGGLALFPEILRNDLRAIRSTIEAFSRSKELEGNDEGAACGLKFHAHDSAWNYTVRVTSKAGRVSYKLDRWD